MNSSKEISKKKSAELEKAADYGVHHNAEPTPNPVWFKPVMFGFMLLGLIWIVLYYITSSTLGLPIPAIGQWNLAVGFGLILIGFGMTTRWR